MSQLDALLLQIENLKDENEKLNERIKRLEDTLDDIQDLTETVL